MEVTSHCNGSDITESRANKNPNQSDCLSSQPTANGTLTQHNTEEVPPPVSNRSEDGDISDDSLTGISSTNDVSRLLPSQPASALRKQKGVDSSSVSPPPVCTPPPRTRPRSSTCNRHSCSLPHHHHSTKRLSSTTSHTAFKTDAAHIKEVAGDGEPVSFNLKVLSCGADLSSDTYRDAFMNEP
ncbi:myoD family inhibitor domain-containing protein-like [Lates japonicus]